MYAQLYTHRHAHVQNACECVLTGRGSFILCSLLGAMHVHMTVSILYSLSQVPTPKSRDPCFFLSIIADSVCCCYSIQKAKIMGMLSQATCETPARARPRGSHRTGVSSMWHLGSEGLGCMWTLNFRVLPRGVSEGQGSRWPISIQNCLVALPPDLPVHAGSSLCHYKCLWAHSSQVSLWRDTVSNLILWVPIPHCPAAPCPFLGP